MKNSLIVLLVQLVLGNILCALRFDTRPTHRSIEHTVGRVGRSDRCTHREEPNCFRRVGPERVTGMRGAVLSHVSLDPLSAVSSELLSNPTYASRLPAPDTARIPPYGLARREGRRRDRYQGEQELRWSSGYGVHIFSWSASRPAASATHSAKPTDSRPTSPVRK